jgi:D-glycerate 3-kinase
MPHLDGSTFTDRSQAFDEADALIAATVSAERHGLGRPILVGLSGAQGSGKSTTAARLATRLRRDGLAVCVLSIDDFYLTRTERASLGRDIHPLFETRGVPGTHDMALASRTIDALLHGSGSVAVPVFDKLSNDRAPQAEWPSHSAPLDVVILEGWCVGATPMPEHELDRPINALEHHEDGEGRWRRHVNKALQGAYRDLFERLDLLVLIRALDFERVHAWRSEQEAGLFEASDRSRPAMQEAAIARFIAHYERLTRWILIDEPADIVIDIDADRTPLRWRRGRRSGTSRASSLPES